MSPHCPTPLCFLIFTPHSDIRMRKSSLLLLLGPLNVRWLVQRKSLEVNHFSGKTDDSSEMDQLVKRENWDFTKLQDAPTRSCRGGWGGGWRQ